MYRKGCTIYMDIHYLLFIHVFDEDYFVMHSIRKFRSETCITLCCNYYGFDINKKKRGVNNLGFLKFSSNFNTFFLQRVHLYELFMGHEHFLLSYFKKGIQGALIRKEAEKCQFPKFERFFSSNFNAVFCEVVILLMNH